jgi:hypothetical protein
MSVTGMPELSLRLERAESSRLAWALAISLALHLLCFGGYQTGRKLGLWQNIHWPAWVQSAKMLTEMFKKKESLQQQQQEVPLMFVDVSPAQVVAEAPKNAKYYSDKNSKAVNPVEDKDAGTPRIEGTQTQVVKTENVPREKFVPLQPQKPLQQAQEAQEALKARPQYTPGDMTMAKPDLNPRKGENETENSRPKTIQEALARQRSNRLPAQKMNQEGGVRRHLDFASLDAKATPFGAYDRALIEAISQRWYALLDQRDYASDGRGKVVLQFSLLYDGRITDMTVAENTVGDVLGFVCEKAVQDPSPFAPWPSDMRRMLGDVRHVQFTFYYN